MNGSTTEKSITTIRTQNASQNVPSRFLTAEEKTLTDFEHEALEREKAGTINSLTKDLVVILCT